MAIEDPIITRRWTVADDPARPITATIHRPRPDPRGDWECTFVVDGADGSHVASAHGIDGLQALLNALDGVRSALDASGLALSWEGGEPGDHGIPRMVPAFYGRAFAEEIERYIDERIRAFTEAAEGTRSDE
jgi:hypothetical protein